MNDVDTKLRIAVLDDDQAVALSRIAWVFPRNPASLPFGIEQGPVGSPTQPCLGLADWDGLVGAETVFFHGHADEGLAARLAPFDMLVLTRERTPLDSGLIAACMARGIPVCGTAGGDPDATRGLAWGLVLGVTRGIARQAASVATGRSDSGRT